MMIKKSDPRRLIRVQDSLVENCKRPILPERIGAIPCSQADGLSDIWQKSITPRIGEIPRRNLGTHVDAVEGSTGIVNTADGKDHVAHYRHRVPPKPKSGDALMFGVHDRNLAHHATCKVNAVALIVFITDEPWQQIKLAKTSRWLPAHGTCGARRLRVLTITDQSTFRTCMTGILDDLRTIDPSRKLVAFNWRKHRNDRPDAPVSMRFDQVIMHPRSNSFWAADVSAVDDIKAFPKEASYTSTMISPRQARSKSQLFGRMSVEPIFGEIASHGAPPALPD
nr:hypothetical protein [Roseobacter cerasinus]